MNQLHTKNGVSPGRCGSVGGAPFCKAHVTGLMRSRGTYLGRRFSPDQGACERQLLNVSHINVSLPPLSPPLKKNGVTAKT